MMEWLFQTVVGSTGSKAALTSGDDLEACVPVELPSLLNDTGKNGAWSVVF